MAFSVPGTRADAGGASAAALQEVAAQFEPVLARLSRWRVALDAAGVPLAATCVEGAADALSHAFAAVAKAASRIGADDGPGVLPIGIGLLKLHASGGGCVADLSRADPVAPPANLSTAIGWSVAGDDELSGLLRADELRCGLLCAALSQNDWLHGGTGEVFAGDPLAGAAIVSTVAGRTTFPRWTRWQTGGAVERGTVEALARLGWRRLSGPTLPTG